MSTTQNTPTVEDLKEQDERLNRERLGEKIVEKCWEYQNGEITKTQFDAFRLRGSFAPGLTLGE